VELVLLAESKVHFPPHLAFDFLFFCDIIKTVEITVIGHF
jgi:hypothetical protein